MVSASIQKIGFSASLNEETAVKLPLLYFKLRDTSHLFIHDPWSAENKRMNDTIQTIPLSLIPIEATGPGVKIELQVNAYFGEGVISATIPLSWGMERCVFIMCFPFFCFALRNALSRYTVKQLSTLFARVYNRPLAQWGIVDYKGLFYLNGL